MNGILEKRNLIIEVLFSALISWLVFHVPEEEFEVPRMMWLYFSVIAALAYIAFLRGIRLNDIWAWGVVWTSMIFLFFFWKQKGICSQNYGEQYSLVLRLRHVGWALFLGLLLDLVRHKPVHLRNVIKTPLFWLYFSFSVLAVIFVREDVFPLLIPFGALLLTNIEREKWVELVDCFGLGYYIVYFKMFTSSFVFGPNTFVGGRYLGAFKNISTNGIHVSIAVLIGLYFYLRWLWSEREMKKLIALLLLWSYPIVVSFMVNCRSAELGLVGALACSFVFLHNKDRKTTKKRLVLAFFLSCIVIVGVVILAFLLKSLRDSGKISELPYGLGHIALMASDYSEGYFHSKILNKINALTSQRLIDWVELIQQAGVAGTSEALLHTHNVYIFYLIRYGFVGGGFLVAWAITYVISGMIFASQKVEEAFMPLLYGSFAFLAEIGMNGYWMLPLGFYWLVFSYPLMVYRKEKTIKSYSNEKMSSASF